MNWVLWTSELRCLINEYMTEQLMTIWSREIFHTSARARKNLRITRLFTCGHPQEINCVIAIDVVTASRIVLSANVARRMMKSTESMKTAVRDLGEKPNLTEL